MRNLSSYAKIYVDIDGTLVYGPMTKLMDWTWRYFHSPLIANILVFLQEKLGLYKVNRKLVHILNEAPVAPIFLTARAHHPSTRLLISRILGHKTFDLVELASEDPANDKALYMLQSDGQGTKVCLFDDTESTRKSVRILGMDAFAVEGMYEVLIQ